MERILNQKHGASPLLIAGYCMLERAGFYGIRSLIVLYLTSEFINLDIGNALSIYGWFTGAMIFTSIIGAVIGDLVIGSRIATIVGTVVQALGAFVLAIPDLYAIYGGLFLIGIGGGLIRPNVLAHLGKQYLKKQRLLDAGFSIQYMAVNIGAFVSVVAFGYLADVFGWHVGFIAAGIVVLISLVLLFITPEVKLTPSDFKASKSADAVLKIVVAIGISVVFWVIYEVFGMEIYSFQSDLINANSSELFTQLLPSLNAIFLLPISVILISLWTFFYTNSFIKLMFGVCFGLLSFGIFYFISDAHQQTHMVLFILAVFLLSIAEFLIAPVVYSIITKFSNPKYLAIIIALLFVPSRIFALITSNFHHLFDNEIIQILGLILLSMIFVGLVIYQLITKNKRESSSHIIDQEF